MKIMLPVTVLFIMNCSPASMNAVPLSFLSEFCSGNGSDMTNVRRRESIISSCQIRRSAKRRSQEVLMDCPEAELHFVKPSEGKRIFSVLQDIARNFHHDENSIRPKDFPRRLYFACSRSENYLSLTRKITEFVTVPLDEQVYLISTALKVVKISEVYTIGPEVVYEDLKQDLWAGLNRSINTVELSRIGNRRKNLRGFSIKVTSQEDETYKEALSSSVLPNGTYVFKSGYMLYHLRDFQSMLNFTYVAVAGKGWISPKIVNNRTELSGVGKQVIEGEADWGMTYTSILPERAAYLHFLPSLGYGQGFVFYRDTRAVPSEISMLKPFNAKLWLGLVFMWALFWLVYLISAAASRRVCCDKGNFANAERDGLSFVISAMTLQGYGSDSSCKSIGIIVLAGMMTGYLIQCIYSASIMAYLFAPSSPIHSPDDLPLEGYITFTDPIFDHYSANLFGNSQHQKALHRNSKIHFKSMTNAVQKVISGNRRFAFVTSEDDFHATVLQLKVRVDGFCSNVFAMRVEHSGKMKLAMFLRRASPLREVFTHSTQRLVETGLVNRYHLIHKRYARIICDQNVSDRTRITYTVTLRQCTCAFAMVLLGLASSVALLTLEKCYRSFLSRKD